MADNRNTDIAEWITSVILDFVKSSPQNSLNLATNEKAFDTPLVGFSSGADPLYKEYKRHIGEFYLTPYELFRSCFPKDQMNKKEISVISWILPSTVKTRQEQAKARRYPSERWARTRHYGEIFNNALRQHIVKTLSSKGIKATAPLLSHYWKRSMKGQYAPCSNWSERHAAYASGLGTFGLCDGLITQVGKAVRIGSVVARAGIAPSNRVYKDIHDYCLYYSHQTCGRCIPRCPVNALDHEGHDKVLCMSYTEESMNRYLRKTYDIDSYACGLCQCGVPCMDHIPKPGEG